MKVSVVTGQSVDMASDITRINLIDKARLGIEEALSWNDQVLVGKLQVAIDAMKQHHGQIIAINTQA